jgi:hypothetical protein
MNLSTHFTLQEFVASTKAEQLAIDNTPSVSDIECMQALCEKVLEPLREHFGKPIKIISGFRSPELNRQVGGAPTSQHLRGEAADIEIPGVDNADIWRYIDEHLPYDQLIAEYLTTQKGSDGWIHVSYAPENRQEALSKTAKGKPYLSGLHFVG